MLAASPVLFTTLQAIDGLYLIYLGIQGLRAKPFDLMRLASASDRASESAVDALPERGYCFRARTRCCFSSSSRSFLSLS